MPHQTVFSMCVTVGGACYIHAPAGLQQVVRMWHWQGGKQNNRTCVAGAPPCYLSLSRCCALQTLMEFYRSYRFDMFSMGRYDAAGTELPVVKSQNMVHFRYQLVNHYPQVTATQARLHACPVVSGAASCIWTVHRNVLG